MNTDAPSNSRKRKNPSNATNDDAGSEKLAFNEDAKARGKQLQTELDMQFEDEFEDEFEEEEVDNAMEVEEEEEKEPEDDILPEEPEEVEPEVWRPGHHQLEEGEFLEYDPTAYDLIHFMRVDAPCLSFDILTDTLGYERKRLPHTAYVVAGSQAPHGVKNKITVMKMSRMHKTKYDGREEDPKMDDDEDMDEDEEFDEDSQLESHHIEHDGCINRLRAMPQKTNIVATLSDTKKAHIFDLSRHIKALDVPSSTKLKTPPALYTFTGHQDEGFALDWSSVVAGRLATGDCSKGLHVWNMTQAGTWAVSSSLKGHTDSVEDLQWSPEENDILASTGVDRTIRIWDTRAPNCLITEQSKHKSDINVISWNRIVKNLLVSGGDDGVFKVWDLQKFSEPLYTFDWHAGPITSVEWSPHDPSVLAVSSEDNSVTLWDVTLTKDPNEKSDYPPQLLFMHQGQKDIKEVHWHKQIPDLLISTASDGFNVWKPSLEDS